MIKRILMAVWLGLGCAGAAMTVRGAATALEKDFVAPQDSARPWVYWYFMDGNLTREGMTADLEAMKRAGIGGMIFLEVNLGLPRGPVDFMSRPWRELLKHAVNEADRLGLQIALGAGPGWCGTGGPWVKPEQSMQHLVASETKVAGPAHFEALLPQPAPRPPFFGEDTLTPELRKLWKEFYRDVAVLAYPAPSGDYRIPDVDEKALYFRAPYSSQPGVKPFLPAPADFPQLPAAQCLATNQMINLTAKLRSDGRLVWDVPPGNWTIMRFGRTTTGQTTRPAPQPGLGFESDKFNRAALEAHYAAFVGTLLKEIGPRKNPGTGLTMIHFDSWEMSSQNWSEHFREDFRKRRGYDPLPFLPAMLGRAVGSLELSERFLWDLRQTAQELVIQNHAMVLKELSHQQGLALSIEPYDLNPTSDLYLGSIADVPMCEFWSKGYGFPTEFSCFEAVSIAHTMGRKIVGAEAFTSMPGEDWRQYPGSMKNQADWALGCGINRFVIHRYQHQPWLDRFPGLTMGPHGVYWERTQTWWNLASAFHTYLSRCQMMLRRGLPVADILYLAGEGAPHVFRPPPSATRGDLPDRLGYNFDGCAPSTLLERASVKHGRIAFPDGLSYAVLVLPQLDTMTPGLLKKIKHLAAAGATIIGAPPRKSPSLENYPRCDDDVKKLAAEIWSGDQPQVVLWPQANDHAAFPDLYPNYETTARVLAQRGVQPDFESDRNIRYLHRHDEDADIYFLANGDDRPTEALCSFRVAGKSPELWDAVTGKIRALPEFSERDRRTLVPMKFEPHQSFFVLFRKKSGRAGSPPSGKNFFAPHRLADLSPGWEVAFDPKWGGPEKPVEFAKLEDWTKRPEPGIKYYSGTATYRKTFDTVSIPLAPRPSSLFLDLGPIHGLARVKLNGQDCGVVWCAPWRVDITSAVMATGNRLEIEVANLWPNRLIGDLSLPADKRFTWTTRNPFRPDSPLLESGLPGPVILMTLE